MPRAAAAFFAVAVPTSRAWLAVAAWKNKRDLSLFETRGRQGFGIAFGLRAGRTSVAEDFIVPTAPTP